MLLSPFNLNYILSPQTKNVDFALNTDWHFYREEPLHVTWQPKAKHVLKALGSRSQSIQTFPINTTASRYLCVVVRSSFGNPYGSLAELELLDSTGKPISRSSWKITAVTSEETSSENGQIQNILDGKPNTIWHSRWSQNAPNGPHAFVIDLGASTQFSSLRLTSRKSGINGIFQEFDVYTSNQPIELYEPTNSTKFSLSDIKGKTWEPVALPHSARLETDEKLLNKTFQGICWYKKNLDFPAGSASKRTWLKFEGAMQLADIWVNGKRQLTHTGGYLPFLLDLSKEARTTKTCEIIVRLDNQDHPEFPPGRPQNALDFTYSGGLYRKVHLIQKGAIHITDPMEGDRVGGGGIFVSFPAISQKLAKIQIRTNITNDAATPTKLQVSHKLIDPQGKVTQISGETVLTTNNTDTQTITLKNPRLWDLDHPNLYRLVTQIRDGRKLLDEQTTRVGIRKLNFDHQRGFFLNDKPIHLRGTNRHMQYPVVGNAASDEAQYRDVVKLKAAGFHYLRLAHYPQSQAMLDACDELGMLVIDPTPGWQHFENTPAFRNHVLKDIRQMVRRDRNHPSVMIFETCLNETYGAPDDFWIQCSKTAHEESLGATLFTGGDSYGKQNYSRPIWDVPWTGWNDDFTRPALFKMQKGIDREYGDYEFGGEESTSRVARGDGEAAMLRQAWNFQWSHNRNRGNAWSFGDSSWVGIDHFRGGSDIAISRPGALDMYRLPKIVYWLYQSQRSPKLEPIVHIANYWTDRPTPTKVVVYSNCDEVELRLNGKPIQRRKPDAGPTTGYLNAKYADPNYWKKGTGELPKTQDEMKSVGGEDGTEPFNGGNSKNLERPPFTFNAVPYAPGKLEAIGFVKGKPVTSHTVRTPGKPHHLVIRVDTSGKQLIADGADFLFVYVEVVDANGTVVPTNTIPIHLKVNGNASILGLQTKNSEAGIAPFMVRSTVQAGKIQTTAFANGLTKAVSTWSSKPKR